jgi:hypothetical protein
MAEDSDEAEEKYFLCMAVIGTAIVFAHLRRMSDQENGPYLSVFELSLGSDFELLWRHVCDPSQWDILPTVVSTSCVLQSYGYRCHRVGLFFAQSSAAMPMLHYALRHGIDLTVEQLKALLRMLEVRLCLSGFDSRLITQIY